MKAKKICALLLTGALAVGTVSALAACKDGDKDDDKGGASTYVWYAVGTDKKGTLGTDMSDTGAGGWNPLNAREEATFVQSETNPLQYTLTLNVYAGDANNGWSFKFLYKTSADEDLTGVSASEMWNRQVGIENLVGCEGEGEDAVVKLDGVTYFNTGTSINKGNIALTKGNEGVYKFTITMKNATDDSPSIAWEKTQTIAVTHDMYVRGDVNDFGVNPHAMTEVINGEVITWTTQLEVTKADLWRDAEGKLAEDPETNTANGQYAAIQLYNGRDNKTYNTIEGYEKATVKSFTDVEYECVLLPEGKYTITYAQADNAITCVAGTHIMYLRGSGQEGMTWDEDLDDFKLTESEDKTYWSTYINVSADDVADGKKVEFKVHNKLTGDSGWVGNETGGNFEITAPGVYAVKYTVEGNVAAVEKCEYYLVGTFVDAENNAVNFGDKGIVKDVHPMFVAGEGNMTATVKATDVTGMPNYSWMVDQHKDGVFGVQIVMGSTLLGVKEWGVANSGSNIFLQAGTWTITVDTANGWTYSVEAAQE